MVQHRIQSSRQLGTGPFQFRPVRQCQPPQDRAANRSQPDKDFALVFDARNSRDRAGSLETVYQFDRAVVLDKQPGGDLPDGGFHTLGQALHGEQQLMLMRLDVMLLRGSFAEMKELPDLPPELGQIAVLIGGKIAVTRHIYIVSRYK